ncbi:MAG: AAA family ATPase [Pseudomonadota bacterium]
MRPSLEDLIATLRHRCTGAKTASVIALDGRSGVGKSTLAQQLAARLNAAIIPCDDFYAGGVELRREPPDQLADLCLDRDRLKSVLARVKSGRPAHYHAFDWSAFDGRLGTEPTRVEPAPVIIVEGVYAAHPDLRPLIDLAVLVELDEPERMKRLVAREGRISDWEGQWHRAENWYFTQLAPHEAYDLIVDAAEAQ